MHCTCTHAYTYALHLHRHLHMHTHKHCTCMDICICTHCTCIRICTCVGGPNREEERDHRYVTCADWGFFGTHSHVFYSCVIQSYRLRQGQVFWLLQLHNMSSCTYSGHPYRLTLDFVYETWDPHELFKHLRQQTLLTAHAITCLHDTINERRCLKLKRRTTDHKLMAAGTQPTLRRCHEEESLYSYTLSPLPCRLMQSVAHETDQWSTLVRIG